MVSPGRSGRKRRLRAYVVVALGVSIAAIAIISLLTMDHDTFKAISHIAVSYTHLTLPTTPYV